MARGRPEYPLAAQRRHSRHFASDRPNRMLAKRPEAGKRALERESARRQTSCTGTATAARLAFAERRART